HCSSCSTEPRNTLAVFTVETKVVYLVSTDNKNTSENFWVITATRCGRHGPSIALTCAFFSFRFEIDERFQRFAHGRRNCVWQLDVGDTFPLRMRFRRGEHDH